MTTKEVIFYNPVLFSVEACQIGLWKVRLPERHQRGMDGTCFVLSCAFIRFFLLPISTFGGRFEIGFCIFEFYE